MQWIKKEYVYSECETSNKVDKGREKNVKYGAENMCYRIHNNMELDETILSYRGLKMEQKS